MITRDRARSVLENIVASLCNHLAEKAVFLSPDLMTDKNVVQDDGKKIASQYTAYFLGFIDESPSANWSHDCKYVFINFDDASCQIVKGYWAPVILGSLEKIA